MENNKYCNDGQVCKHFEFVKGSRGNADYHLCKLYHRVLNPNQAVKQRLINCQANENYEPIKIAGDLFS